MNIFLVAGHSSTDPGAVANNTTEHKEVWHLSQEVYARLLLKGLNVILIPEHCSLKQQTDAINTMGIVDDAVFSLHMNSGPTTASGATIFYYSGSNESKVRATSLLDTFCSYAGLPNLGVTGDQHSRFQRLGIIRDTKPWAFLIECGFLTNATDLDLVRSVGTTALEKTILAYLHRHTPRTPSATPLKEMMINNIAKIHNMLFHITKYDENTMIMPIINSLERLQRKRTTITLKDIKEVIVLCHRVENKINTDTSAWNYVLQELTSLQKDLEHLVHDS